MVKLTQANFDMLCQTLNHRMTKLETDIKWIKRLGYYMVTVLTATLIKSFILP